MADDLRRAELNGLPQDPVAIVGMSARLPGARDIPEYWDNLVRAKDVIAEVPEDRWDWKSIEGGAADPGFKSYANQGGFIKSPDCFDGQFFGFLPKEIQSMDPQQRLFLEASYAALEDAGIAPTSLAGSQTGVFVGVGNADYPVLMRDGDVPLDGYRGTGMALTAIANRVSFHLDLRGPSSSIDTACSGSLVAIHRAINAFETGEIDLAIIGGVNLILGPELYVAFSKAEMLSPRGKCHTFDDSADGYVRGEGVGALILQRLSDAKRDGSHVHAIIRGSAENHGGRAHSFTAPNAEAQAAVVTKAWQRAGRNPRSASFIETHGTGTPLGDPIEINGLKLVMDEADANEQDPDNVPIILSASKSQIGHLEAAAGLASIIKAVLSLRHEWMPKNLHCYTLNQHIEIDRNRFQVATHAGPIAKRNGGPLLAGVSSFGFGGVNSHIVLQAPDTSDISSDVAQTLNPTEQMLIVLSAKTSSALKVRAQQLIDYLVSLSEETDSTLLEKLQDRIAIVLSRVLPGGVLPSRGEGLHDLHPQDLDEACRAMSEHFNCKIGLSDLRDCLDMEMFVDEVARQVRVQQTGRKNRSGSGIEHQSPAASNQGFVSNGSANQLEAISHTLMVGRDALPERLAFVAATVAELTEKLQSFVDGISSERSDVFSGKAKRIRQRDRNAAKDLGSGEHGGTVSVGDHLAAVAKKWVGDRAYVLNWNDLQTSMVSPRRVPLPTYPFALERTWFVSASEKVETEFTPEVAKQASRQSGASSVPTPPTIKSSDVRGPLSSWRLAWKDGLVSPPVSLMPLAVILQATARKGPESFSIEDIIFASPHHVAGDALTCANFTSGAHRMVQCLNGAKPPIPLMQGRFVPDRIDPAMHAKQEGLAASDAAEGLQLDPATYDDVLRHRGIQLDAALQSVTSAHVSQDDDRLHMSVSLPAYHSNIGRFWSALIAALLIGFLRLERSRDLDQKILVPKSLGLVSIKPELLSQIQAIEIQKTAALTFDLRFATADGDLGMYWRNLRTGGYRVSPQPRQASAETSEGAR